MYIEKESLLEKAKGLSGDVFAAPLIIAEIEKADVVEVVHCKDCGYYNGKICMGVPGEPGMFRKPNDFCSLGKKGD